MPCCNRSAAFKAGLVLEANPGARTITKIAFKHEVHPNQFTEWGRQLLEGAADVVSSGRQATVLVDLKALRFKIGQRSPEFDFVACAVGY